MPTDDNRTQPPTLGMREAERKLWEFSQLQDGWDGYHARRPSSGEVAFALNVLRRIEDCVVEVKTPVPLLDGGIVLSFKMSGGWYECSIEKVDDV